MQTTTLFCALNIDRYMYSKEVKLLVIYWFTLRPLVSVDLIPVLQTSDLLKSEKFLT